MAQEIERMGIPTALITSLDTVAAGMGCCRIVRGAGVTHVTGDPFVSVKEEGQKRRRLVDLALQALATRADEEKVLLGVEG